jgi:hypothetical protein
MFIPFGEYRPDSASLDQGTTSLAKNVIPGVNGEYLPLPGLTTYSDPLPARPRGVIGVRASDLSTMVYVGTDTQLILGSGRQWLGKGGPYSLLTDEQWRFTQWRNTVIAVSWGSPVQSTVISGPNFSDLITSNRRPKARHVMVVNRDWVVLGNCSDSVDGDRPTRVWYLARGTPSNADPNLTTQAGFEDLDAEDGAIQGMIGAEYGTIILDRAIWRMTYEGGSTVYRFDKVVRNKGCISAGSVVGFGRVIFFWSDDGPYMFDGAKAEPIGHGKIAHTVASEMNNNARAWISAAIFPKQTVVMWAIPTGSDIADKIYLYNWTTGRWSYADLRCEMLFSAYSASAFIDEVDYTNLLIDEAPYSGWSIDGTEFLGGTPTLGAFREDHRMGFLNSSPLEALIETAEMAPFTDRRASLTEVRPIINGTNDVSVGVLQRDNLGQEPALVPERNVNLIGSVNIWAQARYLRARVRIPNGFTHALGVNMDFKREGLR